MDYDSIKGFDDLRGLSDQENVRLMRIDLSNMVSVFLEQSSSKHPFEIVVKLGALKFTKKFDEADWAYLQKPYAGKILTGIATSAALEEIKFELASLN